jgi:fatty acid desaturase
MTDRSNHPQFEADDLANTKIQLANHSDPSLSPQENSAHSNRAKTIAKVLNSISIAAIIWGWFFPRPNKVVIVLLVGLPLTAIVLLAQSKGLYHIRRLAGNSWASRALPANAAELRNISRRVLCLSKNFGVIFVPPFECELPCA